ncbi:MAG: CpsD/CapB family tyrosine-protein kinase [Spirochaetaceae bacterium]|nr:CpsD/CapB family tyrosine-protein kinase [Spirochaetaceae bacterium]
MGEIADALARAREGRAEPPRNTARERRPVPPTRSPLAAPPDTTPPERDHTERDAPASSARADEASRRPDEGNADGATAAGAARETERKDAAADQAVSGSGVAAALRVQAGGDAPAPEAQATPARRVELPRDRGEGWIGRVCLVDPGGAAATRFRHLAVRMRGVLAERKLRSVLVTSAVAGEGKTTVSTNLALALASVSPDERIALVDLDLRRGRIDEVVRAERGPGITSVLAGECSLDEIRLETDLDNLDVFPVGPHATEAHALLGSAADRLLRQLHARYDYVVLDGPPVLPVPDVPLLAPLVGGALVVAASGRSRHRALAELLDLVPRQAILGVFLNEYAGAASKQRYGYYSYDAAPRRAATGDES